MFVFSTDDENEVWRVTVASYVLIQEFGFDAHFRVPEQGRARWQLVIRRVALPFDGGESIFEDRFNQFLKDAFAVATVGHDDNPGFRLVKNDRVIPPAIVMPFLEKCLAVRSPVKSPAQTITES